MGAIGSSCSARTLRSLEVLHHASRRDRIAADVLRERAEAERDLIESGEYHRWLNVANTYHQYIREVFDFMPRDSDDDWTNIRLRLAAVPQALDRLRASFTYAAADGKVAARRQALACADSCEVWGQPGGAFCELANECESFDLMAEAEQAARAFVEYGHWLRNDYAAIASAEDPVGPERYRLLARYHNGTDLDLAETYAWGWEELHTIQLRMGDWSNASRLAQRFPSAPAA